MSSRQEGRLRLLLIATTLGAALPSLGAVQAHWSFDATPSGGKYADYSGNSNDITVTTAPNHLTSGTKFGAGAVLFDSSGQDLLTLPGNGGIGALPIVSNSFSVSLWIKRTTLGEHWAICQGASGTANTTLHLGFRKSNDKNNPDRFSFGFWSDDLHHTATPTDLTTWHHYAMTYNAVTHEQRIVIDGDAANAASRGTSSASGHHFNGDGTNDFWIGCRQGNAGWFNGSMDEVWVMDHVLSDTQIRHLYDDNIVITPGTASPDGVLAHWTFDEPAIGGAHKDASPQNQYLWDVTAPTHVTSDKRFGAGALDFEADNAEYLKLGGIGPVGTLGLESNSFSVCFWVKRESIGTEHFVVGQGDEGTDGKSLHCGFRADGRVTLAFWSNDLNYPGSSVTQDTNGWHHYAMSYDATTKLQRIVVDSDFATAVSRTATGHFKGSGNNDFWIGHRRDGREFDGLVDEVWVINRAITDDEIKNLYRHNSLDPVGTVLIAR